MKRCLMLVLLCFLLFLACPLALAEETIFPASNSFSDAATENAHLMANKVLHDHYLFHPDLYTCTVTIKENKSFLFEYSWQYSPTVIFSASVSENLERIESLSFNADFSFDNYYDELTSYFDSLFGNWTLEQKAWLTSVIDEHWDFEVFRTYYLDSRYTPYVTDLFEKFLTRERCGLPNNDTISQEEAYAIAMAYAEQDEAIAALKPWKVVQTYYLVNDPQKPVWCFRLGKNYAHTYDIVIDAYTGSLEKITEREI